MRSLCAIAVLIGFVPVLAAQAPVEKPAGGAPPAELPPVAVPNVAPPVASKDIVTAPTNVMQPDANVPVSVGPDFVLMIPGPRPGLYGGLDLGLLFPRVTSTRARSGVEAPPFFVDEIRMGSAPLDTTLSPKVTLGYHLPEGRGEFALTYRNLATQGQLYTDSLDPLGNSVLNSRLDINEVGIYYASIEQPVGALWSLRWEFGARFASIYYDSQASGLILGPSASNHFVGAGPQLAFNVTRECPGTGLALFARAEFADYLGRIQQKFGERIGDPAMPVAFGYAEQDASQSVPYLGLQLGLSWISGPNGRYRVTTGYQFDEWWNTARIFDSRGNVQAQGLFFRTEINF